MADDRRLQRIHPCVYVRDPDGETTAISLEWCDQNASHVELLSYCLIMRYDDGTKEEIHFDSFDAMAKKIGELAAASKSGRGE